jgi:hypothetical protein
VDVLLVSPHNDHFSTLFESVSDLSQDYVALYRECQLHLSIYIDNTDATILQVHGNHSWSSSIDNAILLVGAIVGHQFFDDT